MNPEDSLLRVLMADNATFWQVAEIVCPDDFSPKARKLYGAIADAVKAGQSADAVTLADTLGDELGLEAVDIASKAIGVASNVASYARMVAEKGEARRVQQAGARIALCDSYAAAQALLATVRPMQTQKLKSVKDGLGEMVDTLQRRYDANGDVSGIPTGVASLDLLTAGWQPGNLVVLAARPGMGKSAFAVQAAIAAGRTLFFSLEMTAGELMERAVSNIGSIPGRWLRFPRDAPDHAMSLVTEASRKVSMLPLLLDDSAGLTVEAICSRARQEHMADPVKLIIVDHLGLIAREGKHDPSELGAITAQLKRLAKETGATVLLLCQLNRGLEARNDKRPQLSDLRDSGRIEEDADIVLMLYRDEYYTKGGPLDGFLEIIIRKNRSGEQGTAWAKSLLGCMQLESCDAPEQPIGQAASNDGGGGFKARFGANNQPRPVSSIRGDH
jgi:replicative DNA helicase